MSTVCLYEGYIHCLVCYTHLCISKCIDVLGITSTEQLLQLLKIVDMFCDGKYVHGI